MPSNYLLAPFFLSLLFLKRLRATWRELKQKGAFSFRLAWRVEQKSMHYIINSIHVCVCVYIESLKFITSFSYSRLVLMITLESKFWDCFFYVFLSPALPQIFITARKCGALHFRKTLILTWNALKGKTDARLTLKKNEITVVSYVAYYLSIRLYYAYYNNYLL